VHLSNVDTIAAIATAQGRGGIGVIRVSGPDISRLVCGILGKIPTPRYATFCSFKGEKGETIDQGIALYFLAPHSYTGENILELQGHGGYVVLQLLLQRCVELGARLAHPGEFTKRAFLNNKLDLTQAESVADLIDANTSEAARSAMRSMQGEFSDSIRFMVDKLIRLRMMVEAMLDFPEDDVEPVNIQQLGEVLNDLCIRLDHTLRVAKQGSLLREGAHVVIVGQPNAGKSSLINRLSGEEVALVSDVPGTTRDVIRQAIQINGVPLHIIDTAGLRETQDAVEILGVERTQQSMQQADLILMLLDANKGITVQDEKIISELPAEIPKLLAFNKVDLINAETNVLNKQSDHIYLSVKTGEGMDVLQSKLLKAIGWRDQESGAFMARERHLKALNQAKNHLIRAGGEITRTELLAEELRCAQQILCEITGEFTSDDLLGEIFSRFCIGK